MNRCIPHVQPLASAKPVGAAGTARQPVAHNPFLAPLPRCEGQLVNRDRWCSLELKPPATICEPSGFASSRDRTADEKSHDSRKKLNFVCLRNSQSRASVAK